MWMLQLLTTGSWLLKTTVCHQSELKGKTWVTVLACVWLKQIGHRYELLWITHKEINSDISQMFHRFKWYCKKEDWA